jgi:hypothetical protein
MITMLQIMLVQKKYDYALEEERAALKQKEIEQH